MDATPVTLGQEFGGYARQMRLGVERDQPRRCRAWPRCRSAARPSAPASTRRLGFPQKVIALLAEDTGLPLTEALRPLRGAGRARRPRRGIRSTARHRGQPHQDLQRPALDGIRPQHRARRDPPPRPAARLLDHAGQGQPGHPGGGAHGVRPRDRQRRDHRLVRRVRRVRAERGHPGDGHGPAGVDPAAVQLHPAAGRQDDRRASWPTSSAPARWPSRRRRS